MMKTFNRIKDLCFKNPVTVSAGISVFIMITSLLVVQHVHPEQLFNVVPDAIFMALIWMCIVTMPYTLYWSSDTDHDKNNIGGVAGVWQIVLFMVAILTAAYINEHAQEFLGTELFDDAVVFIATALWVVANAFTVAMHLSAQVVASILFGYKPEGDSPYVIH